jgi:hypothetical protein
LADLLKVEEVNLALVVCISHLLDFSDEFGPLFSNLSAELDKQLDSFICVHLLMEITVVQVIFRWLKALLMLAALEPCGFWFVLSEVQAFLRKQLAANRELEVFVRDNSVTVNVEVVEALVKHVFWDVEAPEMQEELEFVSCDVSCLFNAQVHEGLA